MPAEGGRSAGRRIGLALGGGGARGFGHIPVLEVLDELGLKPSIIAGTSIGAVIGACYASGLSGRDLADFAGERFRHRSEVLARLWQLRPKRVRDLFAQGALTLGQFDAERVLERFLPGLLPATFADLAIPLKLVATDFYGWAEAVLHEGPLSRAIAASMAIPVLFRPVVIDGRVMIDGGISNPLPFDLLAEGAEIVIAVDVLGGPTRHHGKLPGSTEAIFGAAQLVMRAITKEKLRTARPPDILVSPPPNAFRVLDFMKASAIIKAAEPMKDDVKRALDRILAV
jgi:NTE family protein